MATENTSSVESAEQWDVAIVGYGPVGMVMAALLGRAGHRVVVLERYAGLYNLPRAAIFDDETMRTFASLGIAEGLLPKLHIQHNYEWRNGDGRILIEHDFAAIGRSGWAEWYMMYQPDLEDALNGACVEAGVEVRFDSEVTGYRQSDGGVTVEFGDRSLSARYVIAADGGNSFTRRSLEIGMRDLGFSEPWMVCDFTLTGEPDLPMARQVCDPRQPISIISLGPDHHRFSFMLDSEEAFAVESLPDRVWDRVSRYLQSSDADLLRVATYTFRSLLADDWRSGRIILAGDAAHQMPPFLGQGMCSGIRDAQNLAMRLDLILAGSASDNILDAYQSEREPQVEAVIRKGIELGRVQTLRDEAAVKERDRVYLANRSANQHPEKIRFPGIGDGLVANSSGAGELFPQGRLKSTTKAMRFDELFGSGWFLITMPELLPSVSDASADLTEIVPARVVAVSASGGDASGALVDVDGTYSDWFADHGARAVLVRPDFYVFGTAKDDRGVRELIDALTVQLHTLEPSTR